MVKLILDTNILVSAAIAKGPSRRIVQSVLFGEQSFGLCLSDEILKEYMWVSGYNRIQKKYPEFLDNISQLMKALEPVSQLYYPTRNFSLIKDFSDNHFIDLAYESKAHYLITGNHNDFSITEIESTKILSPKKFCELYDQNLL